MLQEKLPVRIKGALETQCRAFGIFVEEQYSAWAIVIPTLLVMALSIGASLWFLPVWLESHQDDMQNASIPVTLAVALATVFVNLLVSLILFRMTNK
jgi:uncharacterized membrane protein YidH (DUF202 family)